MDAQAVLFDGLNAQCRRHMGLSGPCATDQHNILRTLHKLAAVQLANSRFTNANLPALYLPERITLKL